MKSACSRSPTNPEGWAECNGQLLQISQNQALFALLGTQFGGNGTTTFAVPDLRGRVPMGNGQGTGLTAQTMGAKGGQEAVTLTTTAVGAVDCAVKGKPGDATATPVFVPAPERTKVATMPPFVVVRFCIATQGTFPSRP